MNVASGVQTVATGSRERKRMCYRPNGLGVFDQVRMNGQIYTITHITRNRLWSGHTVLINFTVHKTITEEEREQLIAQNLLEMKEQPSELLESSDTKP